MTRVKVTVDQENIDNGIQESCDECAIALAIGDAIPGCVVAIHANDVANIVGINSQLIFDLPKSAQRFIRDFDAGRNVEPFTFTMTSR